VNTILLKAPERHPQAGQPRSMQGRHSGCEQVNEQLLLGVCALMLHGRHAAPHRGEYSIRAGGAAKATPSLGQVRISRTTGPSSIGIVRRTT
jgi:hypothetical protein